MGNDDLQASKEGEKARRNRDEGERRDWSCESPGKKDGSRLTFIFARPLEVRDIYLSTISKLLESGRECGMYILA